MMAYGEDITHPEKPVIVREEFKQENNLDRFDECKQLVETRVYRTIAHRP